MRENGHLILNVLNEYRPSYVPDGELFRIIQERGYNGKRKGFDEELSALVKDNYVIEKFVGRARSKWHKITLKGARESKTL